MKNQRARWRYQLHEIIFEADTKAGKIFDVVLLILIVLSIILVMLESIASINEVYGVWFKQLEWLFTILFTLEYILRIVSVFHPSRYIFSFFGIIDLLSILPSYLELAFGMTSYFMAVRAMRLVRVFRIFKLAKFLNESNSLMAALKASQAKITVFLTFVLMMVIVIGSVMYFVEGGQSSSGFTSIPRSIYWAIVTLTTVGYGDIAPTTSLGQFLAAIVMIMGYGVLAVPTGIVSAEMVKDQKDEDLTTTQACQVCLREGHDSDAHYCKYCGAVLNP